MPLRQDALAALCIADPADKARAARALHAAWADPGRQPGGLDDALLAPANALPGRPQRPRLVPAKDVPARSPFTVPGRAALLHAVAHIEFNAIKMLLLFSIPYRGTRRVDALQLAEGRAAG